jgi:hypothetical protein
MLQHKRDLTLGFLNEVTQAWVEYEYHRAVHSETGATPLERFIVGPDRGRPCPSPDEFRQVFCAQESRTQRRSDGTLSIDGKRFEVPNPYRHLERVTVRYASWDLTHVWLVDARTNLVLARPYPLDRSRNADGMRRAITPPPGLSGNDPRDSLEPPVDELAPLLEQYLAQARATHLPPPYLPKDETQNQEDPTP